MDANHKQRLQYLESREQLSDAEKEELAQLQEHKAQTEAKPAEVSQAPANVSEPANSKDKAEEPAKEGTAKGKK